MTKGGVGGGCGSVGGNDDNDGDDMVIGFKMSERRALDYNFLNSKVTIPIKGKLTHQGAKKHDSQQRGKPRL